MDIFHYLFCLVFSDRSMYMQRKTGTFEESFCKNTVYRFLNKRGYRMMTLGWPDGNSFVPVNHCLLSAADDKNLLCKASPYDGRSLAWKRRKQSRRKATEVMLELIQMAQQAGLSVKYVLFDSWFSSPKAVTALKQEHSLDTIAMVKKSSKIKYGYQNGHFNIKEIYSKNRKRPGCSKYLLSINVTVGEEYG